MKTYVSSCTSLISKVGLAPEASEGNDNTRLREEGSCLIRYVGLTSNSLKIKNVKQPSVAKCNCCCRIPITSQSVAHPVEKASSPALQTVDNIGKTSTVCNCHSDGYLEVTKKTGHKMQTFDVVE